MEVRLNERHPLKAVSPAERWRRARRLRITRKRPLAAYRAKRLTRVEDLPPKQGYLAEVPEHLAGTPEIANCRLAALVAAGEWMGPVWLVGPRLRPDGEGPWQFRMRLPDKRWEKLFGWQPCNFDQLSFETCPEWFVACRATGEAMLSRSPALERLELSILPQAAWRNLRHEPRLRLCDAVRHRTTVDSALIGATAAEARRLARAERGMVEWRGKLERLRSKILQREAGRRAYGDGAG